MNGKSAYFMPINRGKESIALDLKADADREIFERLLDTGRRARGELPARARWSGSAMAGRRCTQRHPRLIYAAASGFGHSGPYAPNPAYDMVVQGMGGIMSITGHPGGPPTRVGASIGDHHGRAVHGDRHRLGAPSPPRQRRGA